MIPPVKLLDILNQESHFIISTHVNPDGDGLGSALALSLGLEALGKQTLVLCYDPVPKNCAFLPASHTIKTFGSIQLTTKQYEQYRTLIIVDCNGLERTNLHKATHLSFNFDTTIVIDHHETQKPFGIIKWIEIDSPATALMIHFLLKQLNVKITADIASNIYAGLIVDTCNFRHENTSSQVLFAAAELTITGINPAFIYKKLFESWSKERFNLFKHALNSIRIYGDVSVIFITQALLQETSTTPDDTDNLVEFPRVCEDIRISVLIREVNHDDCKVSLRSQGDFNVAAIAATFGGGGHKNAAGCTIKKDISTVCDIILERINQSR